MFSFMGTEKVGKCPAVDRGGGSWELSSVGFDTCINGLVYNMIDVYFHFPCYSFTELLSLISHYMYQKQQLVVYVQRWPASCYAVSSLMLNYFKK